MVRQCACFLDSLFVERFWTQMISSTSSLRVLGLSLYSEKMLITSQIISMDQEHAKFILATGFQHFWRGKFQKERMSVLWSFFLFLLNLLLTNLQGITPRGRHFQ